MFERSRFRIALIAFATVVGVLSSALAFSGTTPAAAQNQPVIYLTFDDGPVRPLTSQLLDSLDEFGAKATFFPVGLRVEQDPVIVREIFNRGHAIGNHTRTHPELARLSDQQIRNELNQATDAIVVATGEAPACMRTPNGTNDPRVNAVSRSLGLNPVFWDLGGNDYGLANPQDFLDQVRGAQSGDIILLHDAAGQNSIDAARLVLEDFTRRGFRFETFPTCRVGTTPPPAPTTPPATSPPATSPPATSPPATNPPPTNAPPTNPPQGQPAIEVRAKGDVGNERIELRLNGSTVASYNLSRNFQTFAYTPSNPTTVNKLRVHFVNNAQDAQGDRNAEIDYITLNGQRFESESPSVESIGSWASADGCRRGFKQSQRLACSGRFDYSIAAGTVIGGGNQPPTQPPTPQPPTPEPPTTGGIQVRAKGDTGTEEVALQINGRTVATWSVGTDFQIFNYNPAVGTSISQLRVRFTNDARVASGDRNAEIDYIIVGGTRYESEASTTESRGSWNTSTGCQRGFKQSQRLACDGYFQYAIR